METNFDVTPPSRTLDKCFDPRSPSVDVPRTPITVIYFNFIFLIFKLNNIFKLRLQVETFSDNDTPKHFISKHCNKTNLLSEMHQKTLGLDPRSPATDFDRTPILKPKTLEMEKISSEENLNRHEIKIKPSRLSYCETKNSSDIIEINALPDVVTNLNNSQNSTNEVIETSCTSNSGTNNSIVTILRNKNEASLQNSITSSSSSDCSLEIENIESKSENFEAKLIADSDKIIDNVLNIAMKDFENKINEAENKIKIWRDTLSPETEEDSEYDSESESEDHTNNQSPKNDLIIEYDDDTNILGTLKKTDINKRKSILVEKKKNKKEIEIKKNFSPVKKQINEIKKPEILKVSRIINLLLFNKLLSTIFFFFL